MITTDVEYSPHHLFPWTAFISLILLVCFYVRRPRAEHGAYIFGQLALGFTLSSVFASGITLDKDLHTVLLGWREPGISRTYNATLIFPPNGTNTNSSAQFLECDEEKKACDDIKVVVAGSLVYLIGCMGILAFFPFKLDLIAARMRRSKREYLVFFITLIALILFWVGLGLWSEKESVEIDFRGIRYSAKSWDAKEYADIVLFGIAATIITFFMFLSWYRPSREFLSFVGATGVIATALAGCTFGYCARMRDLGFRSDEMWGRPFSVAGATPCDAGDDSRGNDNPLEDTVCRYVTLIIVSAGLWTICFMLYFNTTVESNKDEMVNAIQGSDIIEPEAFFHDHGAGRGRKSGEKRVKEYNRDLNTGWYQMATVYGPSETHASENSANGSNRRV